MEANVPSTQYVDDGTVNPHIEILECNEDGINRRFKTAQFCSRFQIRHLPENPEEFLRRIFAKCIADAIENSRRHYGEKASHVGALIASPLLDYDIYIPIRPIHEDTVDNLFNKFIMIMQSREKEGSGNIYGEPFSVFVHTVNVPLLPAQQQINGRGRNHHGISQLHHCPRQCALLKVINPGNPYCLFYALHLTRIYAMKEMDRRIFHRYVKSKRKLHKDVMDLMASAGVPLEGLDTYDGCLYIPMILEYFNAKYAAKGFIFKVFVFGSLGHYRAEYCSGPKNFNTPIPLYHEKDHFDGIRNVGGMFNERYKYCFACQCPYRSDANHRTDCTAKCRGCGRVGPGRPCEHEDGYEKKCNGCNKTFRNKKCYQKHLENGICKRIKRCDKCGMIWEVRNLKRKGGGQHICGEKYCETCHVFHNPDRGCFIQPLAQQKPKPYRLIIFDFESTQHLPVSVEHPERKRHQVNFIGANVACTKCMENGEWRKSLKEKWCKICGPHRTITFSERKFFGTEVDEQVVTANPLEAFVKWILFQQDKQYTTMAFSHYGGRYDMILTFREIFKQRITPKLIRRGNKLYQMHVMKKKGMSHGEVYFRDSFNLCPVSLGALVGAFDLNVEEKRYFPHLANHPSNYDRTIDLPPKEDYLYGGFPLKKQQHFDEWYKQEQQKGTKFNLNEQLPEYCVSDCQILTEAMVAFRMEFLGISHGLDVLREAITISSACMKHFRLNHLKKDHLAIVPEAGYERQDKQSNVALKYLRWYEQKHGVEVRTATSEKGEKKVGRYKLDGYIASQNRGIEVHGCVWHAHECSYKDPDHMLPNGRSVGKTRQRDAARLKYLNIVLRGGVDVIWECEIHKMLKADPEMKRAFDEYEDEGPIKIRDGFFGGRTNPFRMHYECPPGYKIKYFDFCSLYPFTTAKTQFPVGHPERHVISRNKQQVLWTSPDQIPVKGMLKVFLVPPRKLKVPVMPAKFGKDDRLLFPLCRSCSVKYPNGHVTPHYSCPHQTDASRGWVSTCTHMELAESLKNGYRVTKYYRSWEYKQWDDGVFSGYVAEMMEKKILASGFPEGIDEDDYIDECREMFGIELEGKEMKKNAAMRIIAKLMNNNLWGRFSLRNGLAQTDVIHCPAKLRTYLEDERNEIVSLDLLDADTMMVTFEPKKEYVEENASSNLMLSLWVTSAARIHLLHALQKVAECEGAVLLYCDTDSIVFAYDENGPCPLELGPHLGDLCDERPTETIVEFIGGGCKNYALRMVDNQTGEERSVLRVRGITLSGDTCKKLHFDSMKESVFKFAKAAEMEEEQSMSSLDGESVSSTEAMGLGDEEEEEDYRIPTFNPCFIQANVRGGCVVSRPMDKYYRPVVSKGVVCRGMIIKDFGSE